MSDPVSIKHRSAQIAFLLIITAVLGYFADSPALQVVAPGHSELKVVVRFSGKLIGECRQLTDKALADKAPNMRQATVCPREKSPVAFDLTVNGEALLSETINPSGLHDDGLLAMYRTYPIPTGPNAIEVRVSERAGEPVSHSLVEEIEVSSDSNVVIEFNDQGLTLTQPGVTSS